MVEISLKVKMLKKNSKGKKDNKEDEDFIMIGPRCEKVISVNVINSELDEGIIPENTKLSEGVYQCPSIVKVQNKKALSVCLNTTERKEIKIRNVKVKIEPLNNAGRDKVVKINKCTNDTSFEKDRETGTHCERNI